jgi:hypothetical protein
MRDTEWSYQPEFKDTKPENCFARVGKGGSAEGLPREMLVVDTGQPDLPSPEMRSPKTPAEVDELYRWTIRNGIVDHHSIDASVLHMPEGAVRRCATKMVSDFPDEVLAQIKEKNIQSVSGHTDSDLDSITATFLTKTLADARRVDALPKFTKKLGDLVNLVDYGRFSETDPEKFVKSLPGYFDSIKAVLFDSMYTEIGSVWRSAEISSEEKSERARAVSDRFHAELTRQMFAVYNACASAESKAGTVNFEDLDASGFTLSDELQELLNVGREQIRKDIEAFNGEFEAAEKRTVTIKTRDGSDLRVLLVIFGHTKLSPLMAINMTYARQPPETIVAAYAGKDRTKGGDCYDIGIKPETLSIFDLTVLEAPLNAAELAKREPLLRELKEKKDAGTLTEDESNRLKAWTTLRKGKEYLGIGDPTVAVAGGSLVAASNSSLLSSEDFRAAFFNVFAI